MKPDIYAGILIKASTAFLSFATLSNVQAFAQGPHTPTEFTPCGNTSEASFSFEDRDTVLEQFADEIKKAPGKVKSVGIASYGPLQSVALDHHLRPLHPDRYGRIIRETMHTNIAEWNIYQTITPMLRDRGVYAPVSIHTDVMCGALAEAFARWYPPQEGQSYRQHGDSDVLAFIHVADGIGGGFVVGRAPWKSALHPEFGYVAAQPLPRAQDPWVHNQIAKGRISPLTIQDVASLAAIEKRRKDAGVRKGTIRDYEAAAQYIAQMVATATLILAPHQVILHGDVIYGAPSGCDMVELVRDNFLSWMKGLGYIVDYDEMKHRHSYIETPITRVPIPGTKDKHTESMLTGAVILAAYPMLT